MRSYPCSIAVLAVCCGLSLAQTPAPKFIEMFMPMRDGVDLAPNVYRPAGSGPFPVILLRTPYLKDNAREPQAAQKYVDAGYAYVDQDTRGKGHSKGVYRAFTTDI